MKSSNVVVTSLVLFLSELLTFADYVLNGFTFVAAHSTQWTFSCFIYMKFEIVVQLRKGAEYLETGMAQVLMPLTIFLPFSFVLTIFRTLLFYSLRTLIFISFFCKSSACNIPRYLYPSQSLNAFITVSSGSLIPSDLTFFPLFITNIEHFPILNFMPISSLKTLTVYTSESSSFSVLA